MIENEQFWNHWRQGQFDDALQCSMNEAPKRKGALLFSGSSQTNTIAAISAGEFLYDYLMMNPTVIEGIDFARAEDLSNLFQLSRFAETIDLSEATGDMAQLQGYVAEQMIAQELTAAGYDVEFPETSNQAGWDLLVDGEPFQVKCGASKQIVETHFEKYPDIPVYVNAELGHYYEGNPLVLTTSVTREQVLADTKQTLQHAGDLLDFEIPWITAGVSAFSNVKRMRKEQLLVSTAVRNVVADTASRTALAAAGQAVIGTAGAVLLPGAGAIVFRVVGAYIGMAQGGKLSNFIKKQFAHTEHEQLCLALHELIAKMQKVLITKGTIKESKWKKIQSSMPSQVNASFAPFHDERMTLLENVKKELSAIDKIIDDNPLEAFERIVSVLGKAGIHVYALKEELHGVEKAMVGYQRKL